jgi:hypothetical protein
MFPPEGTVMHKFLTSKWIHVWIAMVRTYSQCPNSSPSPSCIPPHCIHHITYS